MITTIKLINPSIISYGYLFFVLFFFLVRTLKVYSLSKLQVHNTVLLTIVTMMYITSSEHTHLITKTLYPLSNIPLFPPPPTPGKVSVQFTSLISEFPLVHSSPWSLIP